MPTIHDISYEYYSWDALGQDIFVLAKQILDSGKEFDRVVALAKGGLTFSRSLMDFLNVKNVSSIQIEFYSGINATQNLPIITQSLPVDIRNERVLIYDDLVDSGKTMELAKTYLQQHGPKSLQVATLIMKPHSVVRPDFFVKETSSWVIFPNEVRETIAELTAMWNAKGDNPETIVNQLKEIGLPADQVDFITSMSHPELVSGSTVQGQS